MSSGNTAWILTSTALVLFMTLPGLALFYGGLVRSRNVLSVLMQCFSIACMASILWLVCVYSLAFGDGGPINQWVGGLGKAFLAGVGPDSMSGDIPETVFFMFQMTFAGDHPGTDRRRLCRAHQVLRRDAVLGVVADRRLRPGRALGLGAAAGSRIWACKTSPAAWWCT